MKSHPLCVYLENNYQWGSGKKIISCIPFTALTVESSILTSSSSSDEDSSDESDAGFLGVSSSSESESESESEETFAGFFVSWASSSEDSDEVSSEETGGAAPFLGVGAGTALTTGAADFFVLEG